MDFCLLTFVLYRLSTWRCRNCTGVIVDSRRVIPGRGGIKSPDLEFETWNPSKSRVFHPNKQLTLPEFQICRNSVPRPYSRGIDFCDDLVTKVTTHDTDEGYRYDDTGLSLRLVEYAAQLSTSGKWSVCIDCATTTEKVEPNQHSNGSYHRICITSHWFPQIKGLDWDIHKNNTDIIITKFDHTSRSTLWREKNTWGEESAWTSRTITTQRSRNSVEVSDVTSRTLHHINHCLYDIHIMSLIFISDSNFLLTCLDWADHTTICPRRNQTTQRGDKNG